MVVRMPVGVHKDPQVCLLQRNPEVKSPNGWRRPGMLRRRHAATRRGGRQPVAPRVPGHREVAHQRHRRTPGIQHRGLTQAVQCGLLAVVAIRRGAGPETEFLPQETVQ